MADPQLPPSLAQELRDLRRRVRELETSARLVAASIGGGGIRVRDGGAIRSEDFDGEDLDAPGTQGWWLGPEGLIVNRAIIRTGSLVRTGYADAIEGLPFPPGISTDFEVYATVEIDVPDWATRASVLAFGQASGTLIASGEATSINVRVDIEDEESEWSRQDVQLTSSPEVLLGSGSASANLATDLTSLGSTVTCELLAHQSSSSANLVLNMGSISVLAIFTDD